MLFDALALSPRITNAVLVFVSLPHDEQHSKDCLQKKNREFVNIIHEGKLEFPDKKPKGRPIQVTYKYDTSGKLHCTFMDESSKKKYEVSLRPESAKDLQKQYESIEHIVIE